jgi:hypothetical protein
VRRHIFLSHHQLNILQRLIIEDLRRLEARFSRMPPEEVEPSPSKSAHECARQFQHASFSLLFLQLNGQRQQVLRHMRDEDLKSESYVDADDVGRSKEFVDFQAQKEKRQRLVPKLLISKTCFHYLDIWRKSPFFLKVRTI